jgi:hypothetical protein
MKIAKQDLFVPGRIARLLPKLALGNNFSYQTLTLDTTCMLNFTQYSIAQHIEHQSNGDNQ